MLTIGTGPLHDFLLLREDEHVYTDADLFEKLCSGLHHHPDTAISVGDDLLQQVRFTLDWIPTYNPSMQTEEYGLNFEGPTIVNHKGGAMFRRVWASWADMVSHAPDPVSFGGHWWELMGDDGETSVERGYTRYEFDRDELVKCFQVLAYLGTKAASGEYYIVHLGI